MKCERHWKAAAKLICERIRNLSRVAFRHVKPGAPRSGEGITDAGEAIRREPH
jgi:hypothetical protein